MLVHRIIGLVALALLPALAIQGYNEYALRGAREQAAHRVALGAARAMQDDLNQFAEAGRQVLRILADAPPVRAGERPACSDFLRSSAALVDGSTIIALADTRGMVTCSSLGESATGYSVADRSYFRTGMATGAFAVGEYLNGRGTQRPTLQLVQPLTGPDGNRTGLIYMGYDPSHVGRRLVRAGLPPDSTLTVSDRNGIVLVRHPDPDEFVGHPLPEAYRKALAAGVGRAVEMNGLRGNLRIMGIVAPGGPLEGVTIAVGLNRDAAFADIDAATRRGVFLIAMGGTLAILAGLLASRIAVRKPVDRLMEVARSWRAGDMSVRNGVRDRSEFGHLGAAYDAVADALEARESELRTELGRSRELQEQQVMMLHELNHRVKNTLATVQSLARQSRGGEGQAEQLEGRIIALSKTHDLLVRDDWTGASWGEILDNELAPYPDGDVRFVLDGPDVELPPRYVLALGMTVHELTTNAAKYGALSVPGGSVAVTWSVTGPGPADRRLRIAWKESGGPPVSQPLRRGFGTRLITGGVARELSGEVRLHYDQDGLRCVMDVPLPHADAESRARLPAWSSLGPARPAA